MAHFKMKYDKKVIFVYIVMFYNGMRWHTKISNQILVDFANQFTFTIKLK